MDDENRQAAMERWQRRCKPMPLASERVVFERFFTDEEWQRICRGLIPRRMEDKWFVFVEGHTIHFHRSWTGYCIYEVQVAAIPNGMSVAGVTINRDHEQHPVADNDYPLALLDFLISNLLLGKRQPFPLPPGVTPTEKPGLGIFQHHVAGTGYPEVKFPEQKK